jgi:hypothetical protein
LLTTGLWRGRLLTTGHLPSRHPVVVDRGRAWRGGLRRRGGSRRRRDPLTARRRPRGAARLFRACAGPLPRAGAHLAVHASAGGLPLLGAHARLSACVTRGTPTRCGSQSWASSGRCPSPAVCGFPAVWVVCRGVHLGGLRLVDWGMGGAGAGQSRMPRSLWCPALGGRPRQRPRRRTSPAPFFLADSGGLSVGWVSCSTSGRRALPPPREQLCTRYCSNKHTL